MVKSRIFDNTQLLKEHLTHVFTTEDTEDTEVNLFYDLRLRP